MHDNPLWVEPEPATPVAQPTLPMPPPPPGAPPVYRPAAAMAWQAPGPGVRLGTGARTMLGVVALGLLVVFQARYLLLLPATSEAQRPYLEGRMQGAIFGSLLFGVVAWLIVSRVRRRDGPVSAAWIPAIALGWACVRLALFG